MVTHLRPGTYADFLNLFYNGPGAALTMQVFYADLTGSSGPFYLYGFGYGADGQSVMSIRLDTKPSTLTSDFSAAALTHAALNMPLEIG